MKETIKQKSINLIQDRLKKFTKEGRTYISKAELLGEPVRWDVYKMDYEYKTKLKAIDIVIQKYNMKYLKGKEVPSKIKEKLNFHGNATIINIGQYQMRRRKIKDLLSN